MTERLEGRALGPDWRVARHSADELVLEQHRAGGWRRAGGSLVVSFGSLAVALALGLATPASARLIIWPISALLLVVALLGLPASLRNVQRARLGVRLRFTRDSVEGWPVAFSVAPRRSPAKEITRVSVQVFEHPPLSLALLEVVLRDGTRLAGPEVAVPAGDPHPLTSVAEAIRALISADSAAK
ncbi:MAG: hypothetical protein Q8L48_18800 [Archangium sp.]|nr:hypothetical protein [Archangium sp.]